MPADYPQYYQVEDPLGNVFALVCVEAEDKMTAIQRSELPNRFGVVLCKNFADLNEAVPGQAFGIAQPEFDNVLFNEWGFELSDAVLNGNVIEDLAEVEVNNDEEVSEPTPDATPESTQADGGTDGTTTGQDVQDATGTDASESGEPAVEDTEPVADTDSQPVSEPTTEDADSVDGSGDGTVEDAGTGNEASTPEPDNDSPANPETVQPAEPSGDAGSDSVKKEEAAA